MLVQLDDPFSPTSRLFTARLEPPADTAATASAPTQRVSFDPLPAEALSGVPKGSAVVTQVLQLGFDAYGDPSLNNSGVGRLALSTADGRPLEVANLTTPITFRLPSAQLNGTGEQARTLSPASLLAAVQH